MITLTADQYARLMKFMDWSVDSFIWQNRQTGLENAPSTELQDAIWLREELRDKQG